MKQILMASAAACTLVFTSCGDKKVDTGVKKDDLTPVAAVDNWKADVVDGRVASLWDSLPVSYQNDVNGVVHDFGGKVDADIYNEAMKTMTAATGLLKSKKAIILELMKESGPPEGMAKVEKNYDSIVGLIGAIVNSDAKNVDGLKAMDIAKFCGDIQVHTKTLAELVSVMDDKMEVAKIKAATVKLISESGDKAEIEVAMEGKAPEKMKLVKVENRWLPEEMTTKWAEGVAEAKKSISQMEKMSNTDKEMLLSKMRVVQAAIKDLGEANNKDEMKKKFEQAMGDVMK